MKRASSPTSFKTDLAARQIKRSRSVHSNLSPSSAPPLQHTTNQGAGPGKWSTQELLALAEASQAMKIHLLPRSSKDHPETRQAWISLSRLLASKGWRTDGWDFYSPHRCRKQFYQLNAEIHPVTGQLKMLKQLRERRLAELHREMVMADRCIETTQYDVARLIDGEFDTIFDPTLPPYVPINRASLPDPLRMFPPSTSSAATQGRSRSASTEKGEGDKPKASSQKHRSKPSEDGNSVKARTNSRKERPAARGDSSSAIKKLPLKEKMLKVIKLVRSHNHAYPFNAPVRPEIAPTYQDIIKHPMDLATLRDLVMHDKVTKVEDLFAKLQLIWSNSYKFNNAKTKYYTMARNMEVHSILQCQAAFPELASTFKPSSTAQNAYVVQVGRRRAAEEARVAARQGSASSQSSRPTKADAESSDKKGRRKRGSTSSSKK